VGVFKIVSYYPKGDDGMEELKSKVAEIHIQAINRYISNLVCSVEEKINLYDEVIVDLKSGRSSSNDH